MAVLYNRIPDIFVIKVAKGESMTDDAVQKHTFKKGRYSKNRGGNSSFLDIYCSSCDGYIALYQKDGMGRLLRMYIDRILVPTTLIVLQEADNKKNLPNLQCSCGEIIGIPMVFTPENRLAFRMIRGSFAKKNSNGLYPPPEE